MFDGNPITIQTVLRVCIDHYNILSHNSLRILDINRNTLSDPVTIQSCTWEKFVLTRYYLVFAHL